MTSKKCVCGKWLTSTAAKCAACKKGEEVQPVGEQKPACKAAKSWAADRWPPEAGTASHALTVSGRVARLATLTVRKEVQTGYLKQKTTTDVAREYACIQLEEIQVGGDRSLLGAAATTTGAEVWASTTWLSSLAVGQRVEVVLTMADCPFVSAVTILQAAAKGPAYDMAAEKRREIVPVDVSKGFMDNLKAAASTLPAKKADTVPAPDRDEAEWD